MIRVAFLSMTFASISLALPAFPGAEGPGADATGGRGKPVYHVTTLANDGPGSFRDAVSKSDRFIVFDIGGTITLAPGNAGWIKSSAGNLTIAGETAPGDGIVIRGQGVKLSGNNVILRNIKCRPGKDQAKPGVAANDGITNYLQNSIIDHVSVAWADDEGLSTSDAAANVTVQYALVGETLNYKGHGFGALIASETSDTPISYHHCLFAHVKSRLPRIGSEKGTGALLNWNNNVVYNWSGMAGYSANDIDDKRAQPSRTNFLGNYYIAGPTTKERDKTFKGANEKTVIWQEDAFANLSDMNHDGKLNGVAPGWTFFSDKFAKADGRFAVETGYVQTADAAYEQVLNCAGAFWWKPDAVDARIVRSVRAQDGKIVRDIDDAGPFEAAEVRRPEGYDTDNDGMPDSWELSHGLDPSTPDDAADHDRDGYTNLEEYCQWVASFPAPKELSFVGKEGRFEESKNWDLAWQPGRYDRAVHQGGGVMTIDSLGQSVGSIIVDQSSELRMQKGSVVATRDITAGAKGAGTITQTDGVLQVDQWLRIGAKGVFKQTAGELNAAAIEVFPGGTLAIEGTISPASKGAGQCRVEGDLDLSNATTRIDVAAAGAGEDAFLVSGILTLGGKLVVMNLDKDEIKAGRVFKIGRASEVKGAFASLPQGWSVEVKPEPKTGEPTPQLEVFLTAPK